MSEQITFAAELTDADVRTLAAKVEEHHKAEMPTIRASLTLLARSSDQVEVNDEETAEALLQMLESLAEVIDGHKNLIQVLETAQARLFVLLQPFAEEDAE